MDPKQGAEPGLGSPQLPPSMAQLWQKQAAMPKIIITPSALCIEMSHSTTAAAFLQQLKCIIHEGCLKKAVITGTSSFMSLTTQDESEDHFSSRFRLDTICVYTALCAEGCTGAEF